MPSTEVLGYILTWGFVLILIAVFVLSYLNREKEVKKFYNKDDELLFIIYQKLGYTFVVRGYNGMPRFVKFKTYEQAIKFIDEQISTL